MTLLLATVAGGIRSGRDRPDVATAPEYSRSGQAVAMCGGMGSRPGREGRAFTVAIFDFVLTYGPAGALRRCRP